MSLTAETHSAASESQVERRLRRWAVDIQAELLIEGVAQVCDVQDISPGGARVRLAVPDGVVVGKRVDLTLDDYETIPAEIRHRDSNSLGLMFLHGSEAEAALGRHLLAHRPARAEPRRPVGIEASLTPLGAPTACVVTDISRMGASIRLAEGHLQQVGDAVRIAIPEHGDLDATIRRVDGDTVGVLFKKAIIGTLPG